MTFRGWIGYLQCFFSGHRLYGLKVHYRSTVLHCDRCPQPNADTLHSWLVRHRINVQTWSQNRGNKHDDLPF